MNNYTETEVLKAIREFDENPLHYENVSIESAYIAIDCMREFIIKKRKGEQAEKRGRWIHDRRTQWKCSNCGNFLDFDGLNCGRGFAFFCPNCGADMREPIE